MCNAVNCLYIEIHILERQHLLIPANEILIRIVSQVVLRNFTPLVYNITI